MRGTAAWGEVSGKIGALDGTLFNVRLKKILGALRHRLGLQRQRAREQHIVFLVHVLV